MRTRSNDVSPIAGARVASPTALDAGLTSREETNQ